MSPHGRHHHHHNNNNNNKNNNNHGNEGRRTGRKMRKRTLTRRGMKIISLHLEIGVTGWVTTVLLMIVMMMLIMGCNTVCFFGSSSSSSFSSSSSRSDIVVVVTSAVNAFVVMDGYGQRRSPSTTTTTTSTLINDSSIIEFEFERTTTLAGRRRTTTKRRNPFMLLTTTSSSSSSLPSPRRKRNLQLQMYHNRHHHHYHQHQQHSPSLLFSSSSSSSSSSSGSSSSSFSSSSLPSSLSEETTRIQNGNESSFEDQTTKADAVTAAAVEEEDDDDSNTDAEYNNNNNDATLEQMTFSQLYHDVMPSWLLERLEMNGYVYPTSIQRRALDTFFFGVESTNNNSRGDSDSGQGNDDDESSSSSSSPNSMVIQAQTGSGKTLTYLLPILSKLEERSSVQAMIVVPTRELGLQVAAVAKRLVGGSGTTGTTTSSSSTTPPPNKKKKFLIMNLLQGSQLKRQRAWAWAETPQVVIGTPPELLDMVRYGGLPRISSCRTVVVDEVDACLVHKSGEALLTNTQRRRGGGGGSGGSGRRKGGKNLSSTGTLSSSLHELLSKYLSPTFVDIIDDEKRDLMIGGNDGGSNGQQPTIVVDAGTRRKGKGRYQYRAQRQTLFCSATIPQHRYFIKQCKANAWTLEEPVFVSTTAREALPPTLRHGYMVCSSQDQKVSTLRRVLRKIMTPTETTAAATATSTIETSGRNSGDDHSGSTKAKPTKKVLIFMDPNRPIDSIATLIQQDVAKYNPPTIRDMVGSNEGLSSSLPSLSSVSVLRFEDSLSQRADATKAFAAVESDIVNGSGINESVDDEEGTKIGSKRDSRGSFRVLLTTDLAARGLDLQGVTHVIHLDLPKDADTYLHRSGRAGRIGNEGQVVSILSEDQEFVLQRLSNELQLDIKCVGRQKRKRVG